MKATISILLWVILSGLFFSAVCNGKTITVNAAGGADFTGIQAAIADAGTLTGDQIEVAPGTYYEAIDFLGKAIRLYSSGGPDVTILDGTGSYHVVQCISGEGPGTILEGFTITGGNADGSYPDNRGGGMFNDASSPTVTGCIFSGNYAEGNGGGMCNFYFSNPTVTGCAFIGNAAEVYGGGIYSYHSSNPTVINCSFSENSAYFGGGLFNENDPEVTGCVFRENSAHYGGGMFNSGNLTVSGCTFIGNSASYDGGGMCNWSNSHLAVINCTFYGNTAENSGGGMANSNNSPAVTNCTFSGNSAVASGGGMANSNNSPALTNCIFWDNTAAADPEISGGTPAVTYSNIEGGWSGTGNIDADPLFADVSGGNLRLRPGSPCIDAGDNTAVPAGVTTDLGGSPRIVDGNNDGLAIVDMGAYELSPQPVYNVTQNLFYPAIQAAINDADSGDQIQVAPGTYEEAIDFLGKAIRLYSTGGPDVTMINGTGHYHVVQCVTGEDPNTILDGFTITGGNADGPITADKYGGGMYNEGSSPTVIHCAFSENTAANSGGGMYNSNSSPTVTHCIFTDNSVYWSSGGGMCNIAHSSPTITNCIFAENWSAGAGGGISNGYLCNPAIVNCTFIGNAAYLDGGGMFNDSSSGPSVVNCILWGNSPDQLYNFNSSPSVAYSNIEGGYSGTGNIDADPLFVDAPGGNLRLSPGSPCIDAADSAPALAVPIAYDLDGKDRYVDADTIHDAGAGIFPFLDMGAYEFRCDGSNGDINCDGVVDLQDLAILAAHWLEGTQ